MLAGRRATRNVVLTRIFVAAVGCIAVVWGLVTSPVFWRQSTLERTAQWIIKGAAYKPEALTGLVPAIEAMEKTTFCAADSAAECGHHPASYRGARPVRQRRGKVRYTECRSQLGPGVTFLFAG